MTQKQVAPSQTTVISRPPIVAVLGHVDHGKTTLLDTIRKSNMTAGEAGGITQHIGAYQIKIKNQKSPPKADRPLTEKIKNEDEKSITFIDTPGHEAFAKMRSRGVAAADIAILVVAANDGVMPQTLEAISHIKKAQIPYIVAANKIDLPEANIDKLKQQLAKAEVLVEGYGGDVVLMPISAKTGKGVPELLDMILLISEMKGLTGDPKGVFAGVVIEAKLDKKRGRLASVIVKNGTLTISQTIYAESIPAKVKALISDLGQSVTEATLSQPVEIMGWEAMPQIGAGVYAESQIAKQVETSKFQPKPFALPPVTDTKTLKLILKADVAGSLEAIKENLGPNIELVALGTGEITESDILLAKSTGAAIIGFNVKPHHKLLQLAQTEKVRLKTYAVIYQLLDEIKEVEAILNQPQAQEEELGQATIMAEFTADEARVAGCRVTKGVVSRGDLVKILRKSEEIGRTRVRSMRFGKTDVAKTEVGKECGILFDKKLDFKVGDLIIAYKLHELLA
ncbi:MAG: Translation initiation factor IF-2 [Candidatus Gottesmanbacteria bacterium GW2011_GWB1_43_11]|uniref:Translation initiation factor IF-2 n=1 Tax=Candidatus Gottesmanbacteria bacterium GW2011_GWB1_43_11 TaxID=1618446 RepID=A0A0G1CMC2_9BACT|nr:MAG: Translation initiation factor IF-2 [Candidatus Gottesmanbacteria bacterium GW2011_GWA2_42_16]KKS55691.1 MAG: Translation initiation factor IF-2 [Candidatus Gottesmanbacteria bacterium GW2011_GWA1_42_26]KKS81146.1 MAG: Translation initiation factor IF-2 [Candidatus Gottesmanbacteria bacterium GW2011_GWC1_43_10]KKS86925.1 MAG: Translation initiation factor IF-2 [Candidatus Gottesmanbacteria bacterium GW2011_GWB1_43_11]OGG08270.1 MAG: translation initiation factor IF-2 [Candidatus Gottesma